jgi:hypothetical protein
METFKEQLFQYINYAKAGGIALIYNITQSYINELKLKTRYGIVIRFIPIILLVILVIPSLNWYILLNNKDDVPDLNLPSSVIFALITLMLLLLYFEIFHHKQIDRYLKPYTRKGSPYSALTLIVLIWVYYLLAEYHLIPPVFN